MKTTERKIGRYAFLEEVPVEELSHVLEALILHLDLNLVRQETTFEDDTPSSVLHYILREDSYEH